MTTINQLHKDPKEKNKYKLILTSPPYYKQRKYGKEKSELGQELSDKEFIDNLVDVFSACKNLLTNDGSLFIVIGDTKRNHTKLMIPHKLAIKLTEVGYIFQEDIIWYKKNAISTSSKTSLAQSYELILFLSKSNKPFLNMDSIRAKGNEALQTKTPPPSHMMQFQPVDKKPDIIKQITEIIHNSTPNTPFDTLPSTSEISWAYGYDPEKHCPTCYRKFKRHATRKRIGGHKHYPIFAACNPKGKNPGNVWEISTKAHYGNEHFAMFPEDLISRIVKFTTKEGDYILDPFTGRGTTGIVSACLKRKFTGIDLYADNVTKTTKNIQNAQDMKIPEKIIKQIITTHAEFYCEYKDANDPNIKTSFYMRASHKGEPSDAKESDFIRYVTQRMREDETQGWTASEKVKVTVWRAENQQNVGEPILDFMFKPDDYGVDDLKPDIMI